MIKPFGPYVVFGPPGSRKSHLLSHVPQGTRMTIRPTFDWYIKPAA
jgi:hypothetical protein